MEKEEKSNFVSHPLACSVRPTASQSIGQVWTERGKIFRAWKTADPLLRLVGVKVEGITAHLTAIPRSRNGKLFAYIWRCFVAIPGPPSRYSLRCSSKHRMLVAF